MNDRAAEHVARRLNELADSFTAHVQRAAEDIVPSVASAADVAAAELTERGRRIRALEEQQQTILRIVADWCAEYWNTGGIEAGDLEWRLKEAGFPLPGSGDRQ